MSFLIGPAISAGTSIISGILGGNAAKAAGNAVNAVNQQAGSSIQNAAQQNKDTELDNLNPYLSVGHTGITNLLNAAQPGGGLDPNAIAANSPVGPVANQYLQAGLTGIQGLQTAMAPGGSLSTPFSFDPSQIVNNPNYQFTLNQGLDAVQKTAAAKGGLYSGGTGKALTQYAQGLATNTINDAYNQALQTYNTNYGNTVRNYGTLINTGQVGGGLLQNAVNSGYGQQAQTLNTEIGVGQNATSQLANTLNSYLGGLNTGAQYYTQGAVAAANGRTGQSNFTQNMIGGLGQAGMDAYQGYQMRPGGGGGGGMFDSGGNWVD